MPARFSKSEFINRWEDSRPRRNKTVEFGVANYKLGGARDAPS